jgi:hypothetical protein
MALSEHKSAVMLFAVPCNTRINDAAQPVRSANLRPLSSTRSPFMNTTHARLAAAAAFACVSAVAQASAQATSAMPTAAHGTVDGNAYQTCGSVEVAATSPEHQPAGFDLQLALSVGRHHDDAHGVNLKITDSAGQRVFALDKAGALTDVNLPAGHYHVVADFGRIKRVGGVDAEEVGLAMLYLHAPSEPGGSGS